MKVFQRKLCTVYFYSCGPGCSNVERCYPLDKSALFSGYVLGKPIALCTGQRFVRLIALSTTLTLGSVSPLPQARVLPPPPSRVGSTAGASRHPRLETEPKFTQQRLNFQPVELKYVGLGDAFTRNQLNRTKMQTFSRSKFRENRAKVLNVPL